MVQFYPRFQSCFVLFLGIVMYNNDFETKENKFRPRIKLNHMKQRAISISISTEKFIRRYIAN